MVGVRGGSTSAERSLRDERRRHLDSLEEIDRLHAALAAVEARRVEAEGLAARLRDDLAVVDAQQVEVSRLAADRQVRIEELSAAPPASELVLPVLRRRVRLTRWPRVSRRRVWRCIR